VPINTPKFAREERVERERAEERRHRSTKRREFSDAILGCFAAKAQERRERQEALGIPTSTPVVGRTAAEEVERLGRRLAELGE
jgi:hypothetical protein